MATDNLFNKPNTAPVIPPVESEVIDPPQVDELTVLKQRARMMGLTFSNNIGIDALRAKVNAAATDGPTEASSSETDDDEDDTEEVTTEAPVKPETPHTMRQRLHAEQMRLVRVRITCMDPKKKDLPGEIFTVANKYLGTIKKFIPFGEATDNGYHIPFILLNMLKEREFVSIKIRKTTRGEIVETSMAREFAIEELPPLTSKELSDLKASQMSRGDA